MSEHYVSRSKPILDRDIDDHIKAADQALQEKLATIMNQVETQYFVGHSRNGYFEVTITGQGHFVDIKTDNSVAWMGTAEEALILMEEALNGAMNQLNFFKNQVTQVLLHGESQKAIETIDAIADEKGL